MNFVITDAGRNEAGFFKERNDCVVRSYATVTGLPYTDAYRILQLWGRLENKGVHVRPFIRSELNFFPFTIHDERTTIRKFLLSNYRGKFIVVVRRHAFAVIDGVIYDILIPPEKTKVLFHVQIY